MRCSLELTSSFSLNPLRIEVFEPCELDGLGGCAMFLHFLTPMTMQVVVAVHAQRKSCLPFLLYLVVYWTP